ncbi:phage tail length tape measure family protein [Sphingomonas yunnanensis]|uniref:phage tail length tape measure family protein n=1 Tax=Sphingomonas yunnanensis TaxID=310400 RepID=UPI001CA622A4|nr:phage tail length tape measure family protein [Sphingomonas yunnanensis]MBY9062297.1 phage tail length tape measure family protein [Sphingomonas yunnanensis]
MDEDAPGLEVGFTIDTGPSEANMERLVTVSDQAADRVLRDANLIERATSGMVQTAAATARLKDFASAATNQLSGVAEQAARTTAATSGLGDGYLGAAANVTAFGNASTRAEAAIRAERSRTERTGEALIKVYERETAAIGKTREELRALKAEELALTAAQQGNTDLAERIQAATRANAQARSNAAEEALAAETKALGVRDQQAQADRSAALAYAKFNAVAREKMATYRQEEAATAAAAAEMERMAAAADRLKQSVDPVYAAQRRFDDEMGRARQLVSAGAVSLDDYAAKLRMEQGLLNKSTVAHQQLGVTQRFTASETLNLSRQFQDIGVTAAMGMNPLMILVQQGPQIYDVLEQAKQRGVGAGAALAQMGKDVMSYGVTGFARLATFITPVNLLLAGTAVATVGAIRALGSYGEAMHRFEATAAGVGRVSGQTAQQLETISEVAARYGERSLSATRESANAFAAAGIQGEQTLTLLAANVERYAKLTGQDAAAAQKALADAMADPARAAEMFTQQLGLLTGAQYEHIRQLAAQGDQEEATAALTRILSRDLAANAEHTTGLAKYMDGLGSAVAGVATVFGRLDQRIRNAGVAYDEWLKKNVGGWAVDLLGTGNKAPAGPNPNAGRNQDQVTALNASQSLNTTGMKQFNDLLAQQRILQKGLADTTGLTVAQVQALRHDYAAVTDTIAANRTASGAWITTQERAHMVAQAQTKLAAARTKTEKAAAQQELTRLQTGAQVLTQQERQTQALDAYNRVNERYSRPRTDHHAENLQREAEAVEAQTAGLYKLADAYGVSGAAAQLAEARVKAETSAIRKRGDVDAFVSRQIELSIAEGAANAAKSSAAMRDQARQQELVNAEVAAGTIPSERANVLLRDRMADLPLLAALEAAATLKGDARTKATAAATKALEDSRKARDSLTDAERRASLLGALEQGDDRFAEMREELRLIGATDAARVHSMAIFRATQEADRRNWTGPDAAKWIGQQGQLADLDHQRQLRADAYNDSLHYQADLLDTVANNAGNAARGMADAFGEAGRALGDTAAIFSQYAADQARADDARRERLKVLQQMDKGSERDAAIRRTNALYDLRNSTAQVGVFGDMAAASKGFFAERSAGWKAASAAEKAARAIEFALSVKSIAVNAVETGQKLATSAARTAANAVEAVVKAISSLPFPANLAAGAATAAALAAIGVSVAGGFGGGKNTLPKANEGTGTVLGDTDAKSESIRRALDALKEVDLLMLGTSRQMATSLRSIESQIGGVASLVVRAGNVNADVKVNEGFQKNLIGSVLSKIPLLGGVLGGLFGSKTEVVGSGLYGKSQSLGSILNSGFDASYYSDTKKTSKFLGITTGTKYSTSYSAADAGLEKQFTLILRDFNDAIAAAAGPLGESTDAIKGRLSSFVVSLGKIDLKGLTGEQIEEKLTAVFGAAADQMAASAFPGIERFQKVGEGVFETLVRVSSTVEAVTSSLDQLGLSARALGIDAKLGIAAQFDSLSDMQQVADAYFQAFYTPAEQNAAKLKQLGAVITGLGVKMPETLAGFRALVEAQDLTTAAGQATYATLLQLAPAFADLKQSMEGAKTAADILAERQNLERQLLELAGDTAALRALDLAKVDESNKALQQQVWAVQDAQAAAKAADELRQAWSSVSDSIMDEVRRIRGLSATDTTLGFSALMGQFNAATSAARGGDQDAAKSLPGLSQALLKAAGDAATSRQELDRIQTMTASSLEATFAAIQRLGLVADPASSVANMMAAMQSAPGAATSTPSTDLAAEITRLRDEVAALRSDNNAGHAATAGNTGAIKRKLDDVTGASGGDAFSVVQAA